MRVYRETTGEMQMIIDLAMALERRGFMYRKDYDLRDARSVYLDDRKCSTLFMANKRTYEMMKIVREEWNTANALKVKKAASLAKRRATIAAKNTHALAA
jgi:hypothetical protein